MKGDCSFGHMGYTFSDHMGNTFSIDTRVDEDSCEGELGKVDRLLQFVLRQVKTPRGTIEGIVGA